MDMGISSFIGRLSSLWRYIIESDNLGPEM